MEQLEKLKEFRELGLGEQDKHKLEQVKLLLSHKKLLKFFYIFSLITTNFKNIDNLKSILLIFNACSKIFSTFLLRIFIFYIMILFKKY